MCARARGRVVPRNLEDDFESTLTRFSAPKRFDHNHLSWKLNYSSSALTSLRKPAQSLRVRARLCPAFPGMAASDDEHYFSDEEEEEEEEDEDADEEEKRSIRFKAYKRHLPDLQQFVKETHGDSKPNLVTDKGEKSCAICPTLQWFKGWKALLAHAETFKKKRIQQHRGYGDAIREALKGQGTSHPHSDGAAVSTRTASFDPEAANNHHVVWPPLVFVQAIDMKMDLCESVLDFLSKEAPDLHVPQFVSTRGSCGLLVFRAEAVGYLEAKEVFKLFSKHRKWRGYLATPEDMKSIDPERYFVKWTEESYYVKVQKAQKMDKKEHDNEKARLKEMELQVENLTENELKFRERKERFERLIEFKQKEIADQKKRADDIEKAHLNRMRSLEGDFQKEIKIFQATSDAKLKRWREQLQGNEMRLEEERIKRMKEIEGLQKQFQSLRKDHKKKEAEKALERELEVMQKKKSFMADLAKAEAGFNERVRKQESNLQERQHLEVMKLMEEAKIEREKLLQEWLAKQEKEKKKEQIVEEKEPECCICNDPLSTENRAFFQPCGHARICLECAIDVYEERKECPICRQTISKKPTLLPKKLYI